MMPLMIAGTVMNGIGQAQAGNAAAAAGVSQQTASDYSAAVLHQQAGQTMAQSEAAMAGAKTNTDYALSTLRANAAGMGGTATGTTPIALAGMIAARGEYNALSILYSGSEKAAGLENQSALDIYTGKQQALAGKEKQSAAYTAAIGSVLAGAGGLYAKYGGAPTPAPSGGSAFGNISSDASNPATYG